MHEKEKWQAAKAALKFVKNGMVVGLGSGSTAEIFIRELARSGKKVKCVASSLASAKLARKLGLKVMGLGDVGKIDLTVDGADQVDLKNRLLKGGGGHHAMEKVIAYSARKFVVIVDESKLVKKLDGEVPVEVLRSAAPVVARQVKKELGGKAELRREKGKVFVTDNGNWILDVKFGVIKSPEELECALGCLPGTVENGIFAWKKPVVVVGSRIGVKIIR